MRGDEMRPREEELLRRTALRIVKDKPGIYGMPEVSFSADFYCVRMENEAFCYETENEFVINTEHLLLADACLVTGTFAEDARWKPTAVVCEGRRLYLCREDGMFHFTFEISGLTGLTKTLYIHSILREPGLTLRVEQNEEGRRAGKYRNGEYPAVQVMAALHYEFSMRELLYLLDVPRRLSEAGLGYLLLLGFETNNEVHGDYPPHWHLIFRWPYYCGSQAPHIYLDEAGRMTHNLMCIDGIPNVRHTYEAGEWCVLVDMYRRPVLRCRVNKDGGMSVSEGRQKTYSMSAYTAEGVSLYEGEKKIAEIRIDNDTQRGLLRVHKHRAAQEDCVETIGYDPLTGFILRHDQEPDS